MLDVSLCSSCMNRNENLEIALDTWIRLPVREIIIVDWSCEKPLKKLIERDERIIVVRVDGKKYYHHSAANNLKLKYATSNWFFAVDADILVNERFFQKHILEENFFYRGYGNTLRGIFGAFLGHRKWIDQIGGYNEKMCYGWGFEDDDLYYRLAGLDSIVIQKIRAHYLTHIPHSHDARVKNTEIKDIDESRRRNAEISVKYQWTKNDKKLELNEVVYGTANRSLKTMNY